MNKQQIRDQLAAEMFFFNTMGKLLQTFPDKENLAWFQSLADEEIFEDIPFGSEQADIIEGASRINSWLKDELAAAPSEAIETLNIDHNRLLIGPGKPLAPVWESVYFNEQGLLFQEQTMQVREWFRKFGLKSEKLHQEPDDHVGLEFSFIGYLAVLALAAIERDDQAEYEKIIQAQRDFFTQHPLRWVPMWCEKMLEHARTDFYMGVALLVRGSLKELAAIHHVEYVSEGDK